MSHNRVIFWEGPRGQSPCLRLIVYCSWSRNVVGWTSATTLCWHSRLITTQLLLLLLLFSSLSTSQWGCWWPVALTVGEFILNPQNVLFFHCDKKKSTMIALSHDMPLKVDVVSPYREINTLYTVGKLHNPNTICQIGKWTMFYFCYK